MSVGKSIHLLGVLKHILSIEKRLMEKHVSINCYSTTEIRWIFEVWVLVREVKNRVSLIFKISNSSTYVIC